MCVSDYVNFYKLSTPFVQDKLADKNYSLLRVTNNPNQSKVEIFMTDSIISIAGLSLLLKNTTFASLPDGVKADVMDNSEHAYDEWCEQRKNLLAYLILDETYASAKSKNYEKLIQ